MRFLRSFLVVGIFFLAFPVTGLAQTAPKPNVVVIMTDDLDVGLTQELLAAGLLPHIQQYLVDVGYNFTNNFVTDPLCCPSRASFLTGQYPHNHHVLSNWGPSGGVNAFDPSSAVATWLRTAGYSNGLVGKYLNGNVETTPIPPGWNDWQANLDPGAYTVYNYKINNNGTIVDHGAFGEQPWNYQADMLTFRSLRFLSTTTQPFFQYVTPVVPHTETGINECAGTSSYGITMRPAPRYRDTLFGNYNYLLPHPSSFNEADLSDKPAWLQAWAPMTTTDEDCVQKQHWRRMESMRAIDDMVGAIVQALTNRGILNNTVLVFTSDNGYMRGEHRLLEKGYPYEPSIRVPLFIRVPWNSTPHEVNAPTLNIDLAPTIAALAGATPTLAIDGRSLLPFLLNLNPSAWRKMFLVEWWPLGLPGSPPQYAALRINSSSPWLFVRYPTETIGITGELYDLVADSDELNNLYLDPAHQSQVTGLQNWLDAMKTCRGLGCRLLESYFVMPQ